MISDLYHYFGGDLATGNTGDLLTVSGPTRTQQRLLRRLLTNPGTYLAHPTYGAGLLQYIGKPINVAEITAVISGQIALEASVAQSPAPQIVVQELANIPGGFSVQITYTDAETGTEDVLFFNVSNLSQ